jgi:hypothetical protein
MLEPFGPGSPFFVTGALWAGFRVLSPAPRLPLRRPRSGFRAPGSGFSVPPHPPLRPFDPGAPGAKAGRNRSSVPKLLSYSGTQEPRHSGTLPPVAKTMPKTREKSY